MNAAATHETDEREKLSSPFRPNGWASRTEDKKKVALLPHAPSGIGSGDADTAQYYDEEEEARLEREAIIAGIEASQREFERSRRNRAIEEANLQVTGLIRGQPRLQHSILLNRTIGSKALNSLVDYLDNMELYGSMPRGDRFSVGVAPQDDHWHFQFGVSPSLCGIYIHAILSPFRYVPISQLRHANHELHSPRGEAKVLRPCDIIYAIDDVDLRRRHSVKETAINRLTPKQPVIFRVVRPEPGYEETLPEWLRIGWSNDPLGVRFVAVKLLLSEADNIQWYGDHARGFFYQMAKQLDAWRPDKARELPSVGGRHPVSSEALLKAHNQHLEQLTMLLMGGSGSAPPLFVKCGEDARQELRARGLDWEGRTTEYKSEDDEGEIEVVAERRRKMEAVDNGEIVDMDLAEAGEVEEEEEDDDEDEEEEARRFLRAQQEARWGRGEGNVGKEDGAEEEAMTDDDEEEDEEEEDNEEEEEEVDVGDGDGAGVDRERRRREKEEQEEEELRLRLAARSRKRGRSGSGSRSGSPRRKRGR